MAPRRHALHHDPAAFDEAIAAGGLLALDLSKRRIGAAGTDANRVLVTPLAVIERRGWRDGLDRIERLIDERAPAGLVVGWPLRLDGSEGPACPIVRETAIRLSAVHALPVLLMDERYTTAAVEAAIDEGRLPRPQTNIDHLAAAVLLEDALRALPASASLRRTEL